MGFFGWLWWVDPDGGRDLRRFWWFVYEAFGRGEECRVECCLSRGVDFFGLPKMDLVGRHQANPGVMMVLIIPCEEPAAECANLFDGFKVFGELWLIFQCFEVGFGERVVV